jgi:CDP-glucose 4,6-dehydratase
VRPWQHVLEPLAAYLRLAEALVADPALAGPYNFGPRTHEAASVAEVIALARAAYGRGETQFGADDAGPHETGRLTLEVARARTQLGVDARWPLAEAVERTMRWYAAQEAGADAATLCAEDIRAFTDGAPAG